MSVAVARSAFLQMTGTTANRVVVGAFPGSLWVPTLRLQVMGPGTELVTISPVIVGTDSNDDLNHASGRPLIAGGTLLSNGQPAFVVPVVAGSSTVVDLPVGRLPGTGPYWFLVRAVGAQALFDSMVIASALGLPAVVVGGRPDDSRGVGAPGGPGFGGVQGGGSAPGGGGGTF